MNSQEKQLLKYVGEWDLASIPDKPFYSELGRRRGVDSPRRMKVPRCCPKCGAACGSARAARAHCRVSRGPVASAEG
jgi:hypothetical protein